MFFTIWFFVCYTLEGLFWVTIYAHHSGRLLALLHLQAFCRVFTRRKSRGVTKTGWVTSYIRFDHPVITKDILYCCYLYHRSAHLSPSLALHLSLPYFTAKARTQPGTNTKLHGTICDGLPLRGTDLVYLWLCLARIGGHGPRFGANSLATACTTRGSDAIAFQPLHRLQLGSGALIVQNSCFEKSRVMFSAY